MAEHNHLGFTRRGLVQAMAGVAAGLPLLKAHAARDMSKRILVVLKLSGANDGFNTLVPYADDAYYRLRPKIGRRPPKLRKIDDQYGSILEWLALSVFIKRDKWPSCMAAAMRNRRFRISPRWLTGTPARPTLASPRGGSDVWPTQLIRP